MQLWLSLAWNGWEIIFFLFFVENIAMLNIRLFYPYDAKMFSMDYQSSSMLVKAKTGSNSFKSWRMRFNDTKLDPHVYSNADKTR